MKLEHCKVRECGAMVYQLPVEGGTLAVDPAPVEVVVPGAGEEQGYHVVTGYRPHWSTCVDIATRGRQQRR